MTMKILHLIDSSGIYGAEKVLLDLMQRQQAAGIHPILGSIGRKDEGEKKLETVASRSGLTVHCYRMRSGMNLVGAVRILRSAQSQGVNILHSHGYKSNILMGMIPSSLRRIPLLCTLHGWTGTTHFSKISCYTWLECRLLRYLDAVVAVSEAQLQDKRLLRAGIDQSKLYRIYNGIDQGNTITDPMILDDEIIGFVKKGRTVVSVGRLSAEKNFETLVDAIAILKKSEGDIKLVIIGDGSLRKSLFQKITENNLESNILLAGYKADARRFLPLFDILVISSVTEGLPITMLEAMSAGVPVIATAVGGIPEVIRDGVTGLLVPPRDPVKLSSAISNLINDKTLMGMVRIEARTLIQKEYDSHIMVDKYIALYEKLIGTYGRK